MPLSTGKHDHGLRHSPYIKILFCAVLMEPWYVGPYYGMSWDDIFVPGMRWPVSFGKCSIVVSQDFVIG